MGEMLCGCWVRSEWSQWYPSETGEPGLDEVPVALGRGAQLRSPFMSGECRKIVK